MRVLFLNPPSFRRFDGAGTRYQATRKTKSLFYPVWLSYAASLIKESRVVDCSASQIDVGNVVKMANDFDLLVIYTTTPTLMRDLTVAEIIKAQNAVQIVFVGPHVSVLPEETLCISNAVDVVARKEFEKTIVELAKGEDLRKIEGISYRRKGKIVHNPDRPFMESEDLDKIPFVTKVYRDQLPISSYRLPQILHPYVSVYTGRGCPHRCTFCLWPQTFLGRRYRTRTAQNVNDEMEFIRNELPQVKEVLFEDDTFTALPSRVEDICDLIKSSDVTWSANARADVPFETLKKMKDAGCRLLIVGYESGSQDVLNNVKKGITIKRMKRFTHDCHDLGIMIHGCFIFGLPGETKESIKKTMDFAIQLDCDSIQGSVATPFPGTEFYDYCRENGYIIGDELTDHYGYQNCCITYPSLSADEIVKAVDDFHLRYLYRPHYIVSLVRQVCRNPLELERIFTSGLQFQQYIVRRLISRLFHSRPNKC